MIVQECDLFEDVNARCSVLDIRQPVLQVTHVTNNAMDLKIVANL